jgi:hypothetical protein
MDSPLTVATVPGPKAGLDDVDAPGVQPKHAAANNNAAIRGIQFFMLQISGKRY